MDTLGNNRAYVDWMMTPLIVYAIRMSFYE